MAIKFVVFSLLVATVYASGGQSSFSYGVSDPNTGDVKDQHEKRVGDSVVGKYSLLESDGTKRTVEYEANPETGFNAIVRKEPAGGIAPSGLGLNGGLGYPGALPYAGGLANPGALPYAGGLAYPGAAGAVNPHFNRLAGNFGNPGYGPYAGANVIAGSASGPQGVPNVSHYSHSVVHDISRPYSGPYAGGYNGAYGGAYNGAQRGYGGNYGGYGGYGAPGFGPRGVAQSYNSLTRGEAFPHGYGGYGASANGAYGAGAGAGLAW